MTVEEMIDIVRDQYIEQIYALKAEAEKYSKELEVYKKALELACERIMKKELSSICEFKCDKCKYYPNDCVLHTKANIEYYLKKAREELSNEANVLLQPGEE